MNKLKVLLIILMGTLIAFSAQRAYYVKTGELSSIYSDIIFTRLAVESQEYTRQIEYGVKNGKSLENFYNISSVLSGVRRCCSYTNGVYIFSSDRRQLYSLNDGGSPVTRFSVGDFSGGWISYGELPFDPETDSDSLALMDWLADNAESDYMAFDKTAHYYTTVSSEEEIRESLQKHIENHEIDAILSMGTSPSLMLERFGFDIPLLMYAVSDPIGSGLIESADDSGNKNYWAHVDSSAYSRQMQYYYDTFGFSKIGSVYGDEIVCAIPDYTSVAEENGFTIVGYKLEREAFADEDEYYNRLENIYRRMVREDGVDAYILNTDVIPSVEKAAELMKIFYDANIPVVAQVGSAYVKGGAAMMIVDPRDAVGTGPFVSNIIGSVFNGSVPEDLEQEYVSSPFLTLNLDVADEIGYKPSFEMLIACEKIICSE